MKSTIILILIILSSFFSFRLTVISSRFYWDLSFNDRHIGVNNRESRENRERSPPL